MPRGRVIGDAPIVFGSIDGRRHRRLDDVNNGGRQGTQACRAAALCSRGLMRSASRNRCFVSGMRCIFMVAGLAEMRIIGGMLVHMTAMVAVLRRPFANPMNVHNAETVVFGTKTGYRPQPVRKREGDARRKNAKHIDQGEQPPCLQSLRSRQTHKHSVLVLISQSLKSEHPDSLRGNAFAAKRNLSPPGTFRGVTQTVCGAEDRHQLRKLFRCSDGHRPTGRRRTPLHRSPDMNRR